MSDAEKSKTVRLAQARLQEAVTAYAARLAQINPGSAAAVDTAVTVTLASCGRHGSYSTGCVRCGAELRKEQRKLDAAIRRADRRLKYWDKRERRGPELPL